MRRKSHWPVRGYRGISNYLRKGDECRRNVGRTSWLQRTSQQRKEILSTSHGISSNACKRQMKLRCYMRWEQLEGFCTNIGNPRERERLQWTRLSSHWNAERSIGDPMTGHLGTTACIMRRFYWPTLHRDVADWGVKHAKSSAISSFKSSYVPVDHYPPFLRMAMDIVSPLPRSWSGNC